MVANAYAKLSKCQQFTTISSSKFLISCCKRLCKVIKMLAIHNNSISIQERAGVANAFAKLSKCQQFTTDKVIKILINKLQTLLQSYQNVSNSQRTIKFACEYTSCKRLCKVIKMLAIHNINLLLNLQMIAANAYAKLSKCQQFTTRLYLTISTLQLQTLLQSYQNVSNSQQ